MDKRSPAITESSNEIEARFSSVAANLSEEGTSSLPYKRLLEFAEKTKILRHNRQKERHEGL